MSGVVETVMAVCFCLVVAGVTIAFLVLAAKEVLDMWSGR